MRDIFISYGSEDRRTAQRLAQSLRDEGWSVWWDRIIPPGKTFAEVIEREIADARCVVVLWSNASTKKPWVMREARVGAERRVLIPAMIDNVKPPFEFNEIQAAWLVDWRGEPSHQGFATLLTAISDLLGAPAMRADARPSTPRVRPPEKKPGPSRYPRSRADRDATPPSGQGRKDSGPKQASLSETKATWRSPFWFGSDFLKRKWKVVVATGSATLLALVVGAKLFPSEPSESSNKPRTTQSTRVPIRIESDGETYDLYRNNRWIGTTPYDFEESLGMKVVIECRRSGRKTDLLEFDVGVQNTWSCRN